ncbi:MAG: mechanosensitive ion channel family protein [Promicromonosporaceae bacterium]|nr:mechanosensitive ion channel family protein [Promicromonosporaceae bacterium]
MNDFWDWFRAWPLQVALILLGCALALVVARRVIAHFTERLAVRYNRAYCAVAQAADDVDDEHSLTDWMTPEMTERGAQRIRTIGSVLRSAAGAVICSIAFFLILVTVGADEVVMPLLASAGVLGVALGFGAQSLVRDFLSGIFILIEDQYGVGDVVDLGAGAVGTVEQVDLRLTHVRSFDGTLWHVRNGEILRAGNHTQQWARAVAEVRVPTGADQDVVRAALARAIEAVWLDDEISADLLEMPEVRGVDMLTERFYSFTLHGRVRPSARWVVARALRERAQQELVQAGIGYPVVLDDETAD